MIRAALALLTLVAPGHVEPQRSEAPAGARTTFAFLVEHGCEESPTVQVSIQLPDGAADPVPVAPPGWTAVVEPTRPPVVTFAGGPLAADVAETFSVELLTPDRPGETVLFPTVQTCEVGEIGWIDPAEASEEPAPRIVLTAGGGPALPGPATSTSLVEAHEDDGGETTTSSTVQLAVDAEDEGTADEGDGGGGEAIWPMLLVGLAIGIGVGLYLRYRAHARSSSPG